MLHLFSQLLKDYLVQQQVAPPDRIKLGAPDQKYVASLPPGKSVNIYLVDINENRKLRGNERLRTRDTAKDSYEETPNPAWIDAHYLISAWDSAVDVNAKALSEQETIDTICSLLLAGDPFSPQSVYPGPSEADLEPVGQAREQARVAESNRPGATLESIAKAGDKAADDERERITARKLASRNAWASEFHVPGLPYKVMPPEGFPKLSEFWTTMGTGSPWKPVVYLVASIPIGLKPRFEFPIVTTLSSRLGQTAKAPGGELLHGTERLWRYIGGTIRRQRFDENGNPVAKAELQPVSGVKVRLEMATLAPLQVIVNNSDFILLQETRSYEPRRMPDSALSAEERSKAGRFQFQYVLPLAKHDCRYRLVFQQTRVPGDHPGHPIDLQSQSLEIEPTQPEPSPYDVVMFP